MISDKNNLNKYRINVLDQAGNLLEYYYGNNKQALKKYAKKYAKSSYNGKIVINIYRIIYDKKDNVINLLDA